MDSQKLLRVYFVPSDEHLSISKRREISSAAIIQLISDNIINKENISLIDNVETRLTPKGVQEDEEQEFVPKLGGVKLLLDFSNNLLVKRIFNAFYNHFNGRVEITVVDGDQKISIDTGARHLKDSIEAVSMLNGLIEKNKRSPNDAI